MKNKKGCRKSYFATAFFYTNSPIFLRLLFAHRSSHTRLRQLADFPSLILRSLFGESKGKLT